uniref:Uncharacterized protein n=1 Tax=Timema tahoe TaxID=61484 RepID=A0A7R9FM42_9NEOP|nr:unnamed protein product [Timema tahoe]
MGYATLDCFENDVADECSFPPPCPPCNENPIYSDVLSPPPFILFVVVIKRTESRVLQYDSLVSSRQTWHEPKSRKPYLWLVAVKKLGTCSSLVGRTPGELAVEWGLLSPSSFSRLKCVYVVMRPCLFGFESHVPMCPPKMVSRPSQGRPQGAASDLKCIQLVSLAFAGSIGMTLVILGCALPKYNVVARESDSSESSYEMSLHDSDSDPPSESNASDDDSSEEETAARSQIRPVAIHQSGVSGIAAKPISEVITSSYPFLVKKEDIQEGDWLLVNFTLYTSNAGSSSSNKKPYIGKVRALTENGNFEGEFYRHRSSREFPGLIYGLPDVPDISEFDYNQVVGKLNPPKEYRRGLKKFDIDI